MYSTVDTATTVQIKPGNIIYCSKNAKTMRYTRDILNKVQIYFFSLHCYVQVYTVHEKIYMKTNKTCISVTTF